MDADAGFGNAPAGWLHAGLFSRDWGLVMHGKRARGDGLGVFAWRMYPGKVAFVCLGILVI